MHIHYTQFWPAASGALKWNTIVEADWQNYLLCKHIPMFIIATYRSLRETADVTGSLITAFP
jgi:hypothetical protein